MEIVRPSERQLILKTYGNMQKVIRDFAAIAPFWIVVVFIFVLISLIVPLGHRDPIGTIILALFPYVGIGCISIATTRDHTAVFDLDLHHIRIECYWVLFKKRQYQNYDLINIKSIVVEEDSEIDRFFIRLRQYSGEDIYISHLDSRDRLTVDTKAQEIRDFLSLDV